MSGEKRCFVVQGLGEKTDYSTGRTLNLDASYAVIKEAVEEAGLTCERIDEIVTTATVDSMLYRSLLEADVVIADLSTSNLNAAYELGVRNGLRAEATIVVAEKQFLNPFDINMRVIQYEHLGSDLGQREAKRFKGELRIAIQAALDGLGGSPVYDTLQMEPPSLGADLRSHSPLLDRTTGFTEPVLDRRIKPMVEAARQASLDGDFVLARRHLEEAHAVRPDDASILHQLAIATYRGRLPDRVTALQEARGLLQPLAPDSTNDPETLRLWGSVHKRLWEAAGNTADLDRAIAAYDRAFALAESDFDGITLAFLLDMRAAAEGGDLGERIADAMLARRIRRLVIAIGGKKIEAGPTSGRYVATAASAPDAPTSGVAVSGGVSDRIWVLATLVEASVGIGDAAGAAIWQALFDQEAPQPWAADVTSMQLAKLTALLAKSPVPLR